MYLILFLPIGRNKGNCLILAILSFDVKKRNILRKQLFACFRYLETERGVKDNDKMESQEEEGEEEDEEEEEEEEQPPKKKKAAKKCDFCKNQKSAKRKSLRKSAQRIEEQGRGQGE